MVAIPATNEVFQQKDAELLAQAAKLPFAAIGSVSPGQQGYIKLRFGIGLPLENRTTQIPTGEIAALVKRLVAASAAAERDRADPEIILEPVEDSDRTLAWLKSDRCLIAAWFPLLGTTPFVTLVGPAVGATFPRWQRELARLTLMQESERMAGAPSTAPERDILDAILNRLTIPIALVDRNGRSVYANSAADREFGSGGILTLHEGRIVARSAEVGKRLQQAVRAATDGGARRSHVVLLSGDDEESRLPQRAVVVTPVPALRDLALVVCANRPQDGATLKMMLSELGLTPTEQRLASRLIHGDCLDDAAEQINVKLSTARSYLRSIFDKTGASRQSQLVAMALSLTPPTTLSESPDCNRAKPSRITARTGMEQSMMMSGDQPRRFLQQG